MAQVTCSLSSSDCMFNHPYGHDLTKLCSADASCNCHYHIKAKSLGLAGLTITDIRPVLRYNVPYSKIAWSVPCPPKTKLLTDRPWAEALKVCEVKVDDAVAVSGKWVTIHECPEHWVIVTWIF